MEKQIEYNIWEMNKVVFYDKNGNFHNDEDDGCYITYSTSSKKEALEVLEKIVENNPLSCMPGFCEYHDPEVEDDFGYLYTEYVLEECIGERPEYSDIKIIAEKTIFNENLTLDFFKRFLKKVNKENAVRGYVKNPTEEKILEFQKIESLD